MPSPRPHSLLEQLKALRWRMRAQFYLQDLVQWALVWSGVLVLVGAWNHWGGGRAPWQPALAGAAAAAALLAPLVSALARRLPLRLVAQKIDRLAQTQDRFLTALDLQPQTTGIEALAFKECQAFVAQRDFRRFLPLKLPGKGAWLLAPMIALAMLQWDALKTSALRQHNAEEGAAQIAATLSNLEKLAEQTATKADDPELQTLSEQIKASARDLRQQAINRDAAEKAALAGLSALEQRVRDLLKERKSASQNTPQSSPQNTQNTPQNQSPEELQALAKALGQSEEEAVRALEEAAKNGLSSEQVGKTLKEALERMAQQKELSEAMKQLEKQLGSGQTRAALERLAQMLKQQPGNPKPSTGGSQNLQNLLSALENMKYGQTANGPDGQKPGAGSPDLPSLYIPGESPSPTIIASSADSNSPESPLNSPDSPDSKDSQSSQPQNSQNPRNPQNPESGLGLKGQLGEGESLSTLVPASGDLSQSSRRYKELYEAMAPAAEAAVLQEEIPLASRFFIKRYFESIRPHERTP